MTLFRLGYLRLTACAALVFCAGIAQAAVYGKVEGDRVSVLYSDVPPLDRRPKAPTRSQLSDKLGIVRRSFTEGVIQVRDVQGELEGALQGE